MDFVLRLFFGEQCAWVKITFEPYLRDTIWDGLMVVLSSSHFSTDSTVNFLIKGRSRSSAEFVYILRVLASSCSYEQHESVLKIDMREPTRLEMNCGADSKVKTSV